MLDLKLIREDPEGVRAALARRGEAAVGGLDRVIELDERRRSLLPRLEGLRAEQNEANTRIRQASDPEQREHEIGAMRAVAARAKELEQELGTVETSLQEALAPLPNLPDRSAAPGPDDELIRTVGTPPELGFAARDHLELAGDLIDMDRAASLSGSRFAYLKGDLVMLELALVRWVLELVRGHGFEPVIPPVLVRERALYGTGFLPDTEQQIYRLPDDELFLVGTSEVALASLHDGEILEAERLPLRYAGFSPCFRREAGAAGKDTRGIFRVHQFDKVELFSFVAPEESAAEHERILAIEEEILTALGLPYRVVNIAVGDLGSSAAKKYDCEAWLPSQERYRELTSCSNTTDYQARRLNIRMRREKRTATLHTLNGTAVAVGRTIVALLENGQRADGSVEIPTCLHAPGAPAVLSAQTRP
ncbi:MAG TPA: serine--tRNA ligase [Solirubrobacteraceae bacterium]|jgi:seryl-tRNA synthetase|nr:serine--tRNA ligase [Solirubrobacteraceae bacterium]